MDHFQSDTSQDFQDNLFRYTSSQEAARIYVRYNPETQLKSIIVIHSTKRGPALGGCRFVPYTSSQAALKDGLRLARAMSYKAALVDLPLGGGKAIIVKDHRINNRKQLFESYGQFVDSLGGDYITAVDSGTVLSDMDIVATQTRHVASTTAIGPPAIATATGVFKGIQACVNQHLDKNSLENLHVAVQGVGEVGLPLCLSLQEAGARLTIADQNEHNLNEAKSRLPEVNIVGTDEIYAVNCDIFAPCALGGIVNEKTIPRLQTKIIAGAANNQLRQADMGQLLIEKGIFYAPDYVINAGGLIYAASKYLEYPEETIGQRLDKVYDSITKIYELERATETPSSLIALELAKNLVETP